MNEFSDVEPIKEDPPAATEQRLEAPNPVGEATASTLPEGVAAKDLGATALTSPDDTDSGFGRLDVTSADAETVITTADGVSCNEPKLGVQNSDNGDRGDKEDAPTAVSTSDLEDERTEADHDGDNGGHNEDRTGYDEEDPWEANLSLANAMSARHTRESRLDNKAGYGYDRMDPSDPVVSAMTKGMEHGMAAIFLKRIEDPENPIDAQTAHSLADAAVTDDTMRAIFAEWDRLHQDEPSLSSRLSEEKLSGLRSNLRSTIGDSLATLTASGMLDQSYREYVRLLPGVSEVAAQHQMSAADVLLDDDLYTEAFKTSFGDAAGYARERLDAATPELFTTQASAFLSMGTIGRARMSKDMRDEGEILAEVQRAPAWTAKVDQGIKIARDAYMSITTDRIRRTWGDADYDTLPQEIRQSLAQR